MVIRAIALSLAILIGVGAIVPLATENAEAARKQRHYKKKKKRYWRGVRKYSKRWWQLYRAQERRKRLRAKRRRALRLRTMRLAKVRQAREAKPTQATAKTTPTPRKAPAVLPSGAPAPATWTPAQYSGSEVQFTVDNGRGSAAITVVGPATGETMTSGRKQYLGGVPTTALRREVINRMIRENGWVVNDYQKEIGNKKVYVVVAQSQASGGRVNSRMFYFTEVDGRIYSLATNTGLDSAERIAEESERVLRSLQPKPRVVQQARSVEE